MRLTALIPAFASLVLASLVVTAPSAAELTDLRARLDGGTGQTWTGQIWIGFDDQPTGLTSEVTATGLLLTLDGVGLRQRTISPASDTLLVAVVVAPNEGGGTINLFASRSWSGARAELRQGGVLVSMQVGAEPQVRLGDAVAASSPVTFAADPGDAAVAASAAPHATGNDTGNHNNTGNNTGDHATPEPAAQAAPAADAPGDTAPTNLFAQAARSAAASAGDSAVVPPGVCVDEARAVEQSPWDDELLHTQAACLSQDGHLAAAASIYEQMLAFEPDNFRATVALAEIRVEQGESQAARDLYNRAASHAISDAEAARARARLRALRDN